MLTVTGSLFRDQLYRFLPQFTGSMAMRSQGSTGMDLRNHCLPPSYKSFILAVQPALFIKRVTDLDQGYMSSETIPLLCHSA